MQTLPAGGAAAVQRVALAKYAAGFTKSGRRHEAREFLEPVQDNVSSESVATRPVIIRNRPSGAVGTLIEPLLAEIGR